MSDWDDSKPIYQQLRQTVLQRILLGTLVEGEVILDETEHRDYQKGVRKLIHLSKYSCVESLNAIRELSRFGSKPTKAHKKAMLRAMKYCVDTKEKGLILKPNASWDGKDKNFLFEITGVSNLEYAKMQKFVTLSVTEAECVSATSCVQDMML